MKNYSKIIFALFLAVVFVFSAIACGKTVQGDVLWNTAVYSSDKEFGSGQKTIFVTVKAGEKSVKFTVKTDEETLGAALTKEKLIDGDYEEYGLYVKYVNGIHADYDENGAYWAFYKDGEMLMTGVDSEKITDGVNYEIVYTH